MKTRIARLTTIALCAVLLLGATLTRSALADQPVYYLEGGQNTWELIDCGDGLIIYDDFTYGGEGRTYLDQDGNPIRTWVHQWGKDRLYTNQNDLEIQTKEYIWNGWYEFDSNGNMKGIQAEGNLFKVNVPGYGNIIHFVGLVILGNDYTVLKVTPKLAPYYEWAYSPLCAYFAGQ